MWGRFNLHEALAVGRPCLVAKLEIRYEDGAIDTVVSDSSWKVADGPLLRNVGAADPLQTRTPIGIFRGRS